jgi:16S rRNA (guanine1516-N2)-methyltransferase
MTDPRVVVTTGVRSGLRERETAMGVAAELGCEFVPRLGRSLKAVAGDAADAVLVAESRGLHLVDLAGESSSPLFFHPGMAVNRIRRLELGGDDHMATAMRLAAGMSVLDCTLGMAADALVAAYTVGPQGRVVGLEASAVVALIVRHGLAQYVLPDADMNDAMRRIAVLNCDYREYLAGLGQGEFDVVYFDPMFGRPVEASTGIAGLRRWACHERLDAGAFAMAERVARKRVVLKMRRLAQPPSWRPPDGVVGGATSTVKFLIWETGEQNAD